VTVGFALRSMPPTLVAALLTATVAVAPAVGAAEPQSDREIARIEHDYLLSCAGCHRFDGSGSGRVPSLFETGRLVRTKSGREYIARVPGAAQAPLDDRRLASLLNWIVEEFGGVDDAAPYDAEEVARLRVDPLRSPRQFRESIALPQR